MSINRVDQLVAAALALVGAYMVFAGFGYGYMNGFTPGAGFFPILIGAMLTVLSIVNLVRSLADAEDLGPGVERRDVRRIAVIVIAIVALILSAPFIGITFASMGMMLAIALAIRPSLERGFLVRLVPCCILFPLFCRLAFGEWLNVPLPTGPFGI